jgi:hypothetical protein
MKTTTFQSIPLEALQEFFEPCTQIPLDCDGLAQIICTLLTLSEIPHQGFIGYVICPNGERIEPQCWVELNSDQGRKFRIDYELKDWIRTPMNAIVPIGFVAIEDYPEFIYKGHPIQHVLWQDKSLFEFTQISLDPTSPILPYQDLRLLRQPSIKK